MLLQANLPLERCPHCRVAKPHLIKQTHFDTTNHGGGNSRRWAFYNCQSCGGVVMVMARQDNHILQFFPANPEVDQAVPPRAREFLRQAQESLHAPAGAIMLAASSIDAMLKAKKLTEGSLYSRIDKAATDHLITPEMAKWAHQVRLEANDQRHADDDATMPTEADAQRVIDFAAALGQFVFVLPARVSQGISDTKT